MREKKIVIVDDSLLVRRLLKRWLEKEPGLCVVGQAGDVYEARSVILKEKPDLLLLDVVLPGMDGLTFLERLMKHIPLPVIVVSGLTDRSSREGVRALELGAVGIVRKPGEDPGSLKAMYDDLIAKIKDFFKEMEFGKKEKSFSEAVSMRGAGRVDAVLIASSTGGVQTLCSIFPKLSPKLPPILIVQHMPSGFTRSLAERLNEISTLFVYEAREGSRVKRGEAALAPGGYHLFVRRRAEDGSVLLRLDQSEKVHHQRPAADPLFFSAARALGKRSLGMVLTGMGKDGASGAAELNQKGATIVVQDEASSCVYGMPQRAREAVPEAIELSLSEIPEFLNRYARG